MIFIVENNQARPLPASNEHPPRETYLRGWAAFHAKTEADALEQAKAYHEQRHPLQAQIDDFAWWFREGGRDLRELPGAEPIVKRVVQAVKRALTPKPEPPAWRPDPPTPTLLVIGRDGGYDVFTDFDWHPSRNLCGRTWVAIPVLRQGDWDAMAADAIRQAEAFWRGEHPHQEALEAIFAGVSHDWLEFCVDGTLRSGTNDLAGPRTEPGSPEWEEEQRRWHEDSERARRAERAIELRAEAEQLESGHTEGCHGG